MLVRAGLKVKTGIVLDFLVYVLRAQGIIVSVHVLIQWS